MISDPFKIRKHLGIQNTDLFILFSLLHPVDLSLAEAFCHVVYPLFRLFDPLHDLCVSLLDIA